MRLLVCGLLLGLTLGSLADDKQLLGADDVDAKHALMGADDGDQETSSSKPLNPLKEAKKRIKDDKRELRELQERARALKEQMRDSKQLSKDERLALKRDFRAAKSQVNDKKQEIKSLKNEAKILKSERQPQEIPTPAPDNDRRKNKKSKNGRGRKNKNKKNQELIGAEESEINGLEDSGLQVDPVQEGGSVMSKKEQRRLMRKMARKDAKRRDRNNKKNDDDDDADSDTGGLLRLRTGEGLNQLPMRGGRGHRGRKAPKVACTSDADCSVGAKCVTNRKGRQFCKARRNRALKTAGERCHRAGQCAEGLSCFVKNDSRKQKGVCTDPATADLSRGSFLTPQTTPSQ
jgi:hypothetical protein